MIDTNNDGDSICEESVQCYPGNCYPVGNEGGVCLCGSIGDNCIGNSFCCQYPYAACVGGSGQGPTQTLGTCQLTN